MSIFKGFLLVVLSAILFGTAILPALSQTQQAQRTINYTPFTEDGLPLVQLELNSSLVGTFLVDTGSSSTIITADMASRLKLILQPIKSDSGLPIKIGDKQAIGDVITMLFGGIKITVPVIVIPTEKVHGLLSPNVDGVIGHNILSHLTLLFNFPEHQITIYYPSAIPAAVVQSLTMNKAAPLTFNSLPGGITVLVKLNGSKKQDLLIDTGGGGTNISAATAAVLKLNPTKGGIHSMTVNGPLVTSRATVQTMEIGGLTLVQQEVEYAKRDPKPFAARLGMHTLGQLVMLIDYPAKTVYFYKPLTTSLGTAGGK